MCHGHKFGKQGQAVGLRTGALVIRLVESPELFAVVPSQEVGIALVEVFKDFQVIVLNVGMSATGRLAGEPHVVVLAHRCPRFIGTYGILWHLIHIFLRVILAREREVQTDVRLDVIRNQVDNLLRVGLVPHIHMHQPQGVLVVNRSALLRRYILSCHHHQQKQEEN